MFAFPISATKASSVALKWLQSRMALAAESWILAPAIWVSRGLTTRLCFADGSDIGALSSLMLAFLPESRPVAFSLEAHGLHGCHA